MKTELIENPELLCEDAGERILTLSAAVAERIAMRSDWLEGSNRILIELVFSRGVPLSQLADLMGISRTTARRRVRRLVERLQSPEYLFCLRHRQQFTPLERELIRRHFVQALSLKAAAARCRCSVYAAEKIVGKLRRLQQRWNQLAKPASRDIERPGTDRSNPGEAAHGTDGPQDV